MIGSLGFLLFIAISRVSQASLALTFTINTFFRVEVKNGIEINMSSRPIEISVKSVVQT